MSLLTRTQLLKMSAGAILSVAAGCAGNFSSPETDNASVLPVPFLRRRRDVIGIPTHTLYGALIHSESANIPACINAYYDLGLDLVVVGFPYGASFAVTDELLLNGIPQGNVLALIALPTGSSWSSVSPASLASWAAAVAARYPQIWYYEVINEADNVGYYPPSGIPPATYLQYYNAVKDALGIGIKIVHGPNTSQYLTAYDPNDGQTFVHGYGNLPPNAPQLWYWMTEQANSLGPVHVWQSYAGFGAAIYYQLQDSPDSPGSGILTATGQPRQPWYGAAKSFLAQVHGLPTPTPAPTIVPTARPTVDPCVKYPRNCL